MKKGCYIIALVMTFVAALTSCSTKKNTATTRFWQSFTTRYNVYYNGNLAYIDASLEKENGNKDNYTEQLPLYAVGNKASRELGKGNYDKAIEKSQKAIKLHSINARPQWTKTRRKNAKEIEFFSRKEFNPFMWKAWMLMGRSQFHKGAFDDAAATFAWMSRLYKTQPAIYGKSRAWLAKCYIEQGWIYDAEDIMRNMQRDSIDWRAQKEWDYTFADYYLHTGELDKAAEYMHKVIKHEMRSKQRAREWYILGQIEAAQGHRQEAYNAFRKVISQNPPYELEFNARIAMTEVLAQGQAKKMISRLKRMARNDNNKDYLDQVYYAMGNIYLAQRDTAHAIGAYEKGNEKATRSGIEKGVLLLHLGNLYWELEKYGDAQRCYGEAIGLLDKERPDYKQLSDRSKVLDELVPYTDGIHLQDSLQELAKMSEKDRNAAIDRVIDALKKKEKEERDKLAEQEANRRQAAAGGNRPNNNVAPTMPTNNRNQAWYFYNPQAVQQGKQAFERQWGKRDNQDDWQRMNKTVVGGLFDDGYSAKMDSLANLTDEQRDSIAMAEKATAESEEKVDSAVNDPHKREYYLAQIPFTEEQVAASNEIIKDGLFHSGIIFKDKLDNLPLSRKQFDRLTQQFPEFGQMDEVYYHMFLLHSREGDRLRAETYVDSLKNAYPESKWTIVVTDPYFEENARFGKHIEDSLYAATYAAFLEDRFDEVMANTKLSDTRFVLGENRDKFLFISGLTLLNTGQADSCLSRMETVVKEFPKSAVSPIAGMIINGVKEGKTLHQANFSMADVWNRRTEVLNSEDGVEEKAFSEERNAPYLFMYVYNPDSVSENQLLFQMARFNFTTFVVRNFDLTIEPADGLHRMQVAGFRSFDEAKQYAHVLYSSNEAVKTLAQKCRPIVISEENLPLLGTRFSYNDYDTFYVEHFQPLPVEREYMLYEPDEYKAQENTINEITPALPSETAAPGGVAPVVPKSDDLDDEEGGMPVEDFNIIEDTPAGTPVVEDIPIMEDAPVTGTPAMEDIQIIEDTPATGTAVEEISIIEETPDGGSASEEIIINEGNNNDSPSDEPTFIIGDAPSSTGTTEPETIIIEDDQAQGTTDIPETIIIDDDTATENPATDESIIIEESTTDEIEDEYYELDGF